MTWLTLTIISAITYSLAKVLQKILLTNESSEPYSFAIVFQIAVALLFLMFTLITQRSLELPSWNIIFVHLIMMVIFYSLGNLFVFRAYKSAEVSEISILFATTTIWSVITAMIFLNETLTQLNILGILCILIGVVVINIKRSKWKFGEGHAYGLLAAMMFGLAFTNDAFIISTYKSVSSYMVLAFLLPGIALLISKPTKLQTLHFYLDKNILLKLILCTTVYAVSAITIFSAYKVGGQASIIAPVHQTNIMLTVLFGYLFLHERERLWQKGLGMIFAFIGVLMLL